MKFKPSTHLFPRLLKSQEKKKAEISLSLLAFFCHGAVTFLWQKGGEKIVLQSREKGGGNRGEAQRKRKKKGGETLISCRDSRNPVSPFPPSVSPTRR